MGNSRKVSHSCGSGHSLPSQATAGRQILAQRSVVLDHSGKHQNQEELEVKGLKWSIHAFTPAALQPAQ